MGTEILQNGDMLRWIGLLVILLPILMIWSIIWKGWALWTSARQGSKVWFVILLIFNTIGILEILYIFWFSKIKKENGELPKDDSKILN